MSDTNPVSTDELTRQQNDRIERKLDEVLEKMAKVEVMVATVVEQVKPTLDELMNSSFVKMLGIKKGK
jgi:hypothetical protein